MTEPIRVPGDGAKRVKSFLLANSGLLAESVTFGLNVPRDWQPETSPPHVGIFDDGGGADWPIVTRPILRVTVWSDGRDRSRDVAGWCMGMLLTHTIKGVHCTAPSSILEAFDSHNRGCMASFTARTKVRTVPVSP